MLYQCSHRTLAPDHPTTIVEQTMSEPTHHSYMLRLWRERGDAPWRVTLVEVAQPDERRHFETLEGCFAYLREQAASNGTSIHQNESSTIVAQMEAPEK
jgi:hypothetical protein